MANEITVNLSVTAYKPTVMSSAVGRSVTGLTFTMAGNVHAEGTLLVGTSATILPLGQVTSPHWAFFKNLDLGNFITIRNGPGGADLVKLLPGEAAVLPLLDSAVPYAVANGAAAYLEFLVVSL